MYRAILKTTGPKPRTEVHNYKSMETIIDLGLVKEGENRVNQPELYVNKRTRKPGRRGLKSFQGYFPTYQKEPPEYWIHINQ